MTALEFAEWFVAGVIITCGLAYLALCAIVATGLAITAWRTRWDTRRADRHNATHGVIPEHEIDDDTRRNVRRWFAFNVATGRIPDDVYVWWFERCPEHGQHLRWEPLDVAQLQTTADLPKEFIA